MWIRARHSHMWLVHRTYEELEMQVLRGLLIVQPGHTLADGCKMLLTEHQLCPVDGYWELAAMSEDGSQLLCDLSSMPPSAELLPRLPRTPFSLLVGRCPPPPWTCTS